MLKNILKLDGVKELSKNDQKEVKGGACCNPENECCWTGGTIPGCPYKHSTYPNCI